MLPALPWPVTHNLDQTSPSSNDSKAKATGKANRLSKGLRQGTGTAPPVVKTLNQEVNNG